MGAAGGINVGGGGGSTNNGVGSGGGSGGSLLLEAPAITVAGTLASNGGGGADISAYGTAGNLSSVPAPGGGMAGSAGLAGTNINGQAGGSTVGGDYGGGGGGAGRIRINTLNASMSGLTAATISPALSTACATVGAVVTQ